MNITAMTHTTLHLKRQTLRWDRRLRLVRSLLLGPRAIIMGLVIAVVVATIARMRPWLLPREVAAVAAAVAASCLAITLMLIWLWPHSVMRAARYFDYRFDLKERVSTALELAAGVLPFAEGLGERQLDDAVSAANKVRLDAHLPLRVRTGDVVAMLLLFGLLMVLLMTGNPKADQLLARRELQSAIDEQAAELDDAIQRIQDNSALSEAEQAALIEELREAREVLAQEGISQEEAVAALAEAAQQLQSEADGMLPEQESAYQDAAEELAGSEMAAGLAQAFNKPDLAEAAEEAEHLGEQVSEEEMSQQQREELAEQLEQAADSLEASNPAVAEKLRDAAEALREGDMQAAQQALQEASEMMRRQQEQLQNSPVAQSAEGAQQQLREGQQQIAQAGQQPSSSQQQQSGQQQQQASGDPQGETGQQGQEQSQSSQPGQQQQPGQPQPGQPQDSGQGQSESSQGQGEQGQTGSQPSDSASIGEQGGPSGSESQQSGQGGESANQSNTQGQNPQPGDSGSASVGQGEGGAGADTIIGQQGEMGDTSNGPTGDDTPLYQYQAENAATNLGGQSSAQVDIGGQVDQAEGVPISEGEFGPNPQGEAALSYSGVLSSYQGTVNRALESGRIPLDQRDVIHDYFSSLQR